MRIGGKAQFFAELKTEKDVEEAPRFAAEKKVCLIPLGNGSNTVFADGEIRALVVQVKHNKVDIDASRITVGAGKNLAMLINELAEGGYDLSALTGIPGTIGGAVFGNAGQGPKGIWIDAFVESVTAYQDGVWKNFTRDECGFSYRESVFKHTPSPVILWEATLIVPRGDPVLIQETVQKLLKNRMETQPHQRTAGSCFKAVGSVPAWKLIDAAGLRGAKVGDVEISPKHANFLISGAEPKYADLTALIEKVRATIPEHLDIEMRCIERDGSIRF